MNNVSQEVILIFGATGNQGGAVLEHLLKLQKKSPDFKIRIVVRNPNSESLQHLKNTEVEILKGDMEDSVSIKNALKDVTRVFLHTIHNKRIGEAWQIEEKRGMSVVKELAAVTHIKQVIYSTLPSIENYEEGLPKVNIELELRKLGIPLTTVLSPFYLENFINIWPPIPEWFGMTGNLEWGWLPSDKPLRMPHASVKDFGIIAAEILTAPIEKYANRHVTVVSEDLLVAEVIEKISKGIGRTIKMKPLSKKVFHNLPFPKGVLIGLEFYADELSRIDEVEQAFIQSDGVGAKSLVEAHIESKELNPNILSIEDWASENKDRITQKSYKKTLASLLILWARIKSSFSRKK